MVFQPLPDAVFTNAGGSFVLRGNAVEQSGRYGYCHTPAILRVSRGLTAVRFAAQGADLCLFIHYIIP